jgi:hypothetical protein
MTRLIVALVVGAAAWSAQPAAAQQPAGRDDVKKLEADLQKLRAQADELEARLKKVKGAEGSKGDRGRGWMGWGRWDPQKMKEAWERSRKGRDEAAKHKEADKRAGWWGRYARGRSDRPAAEGRATDVERRLDRIARELEELRRDLKKK